MRSKEVMPLPYVTAQILRRARPSKPFLLRVEGGSMLPFIPEGAAVRVEPSPSPPRVGDVVVRIDTSGTMVHRVVRRRRLRDSGDWVLVTKGDNALRLDFACDARDIAGIVRRVHGHSADGRLCAEPLPRLCGLWIARLSGLLGLLSRMIARPTPNRKSRKPRKTVAWLVLALSQWLGARAICFLARDFTLHVRPGSG